PGDGADPNAGVFRLATSPMDEARAVAALAHDDNFPTVAVFAPRDDVGRDAADAFVSEAARLGLTVAGNGSYDPTGGDLTPDVKAFLGLVPADNERLRQHLGRFGAKGWATFSPDIPFSLLYIPDRYDRAALVAAFLPYFNVEVRTRDFPDPNMLARKHNGRIPQLVQLVGGAGWHHPSLPLRGGAAVQGALIVDDYAADLGGDLALAFDAAFQQRTRRAPSTAAAQAYDAAALVARVRLGVQATREGDPRRVFKAALATAKLDDGACGPAAMGLDGELDRVPTLLEVEGDHLIPAP
ncbi:MAG: ABC transporter substrate-binding protein, partial [Proteobacteria bacterium]|nr:ABC transporter substrate-binding protein [Pseudomonadota bacterium]